MKKEVSIRLESRRALTAILPETMYMELRRFCSERDMTLRVVIQIALEQFFTRTKYEAKGHRGAEDPGMQ